MLVRNAEGSLQRYRNLLEEYRSVFEPLIKELRTDYVGRGGREADLDESLKAHWRAYLVNSWLNALNWRMDATVSSALPSLAPDDPVASGGRANTRFLDYFGFERAEIDRPLLIVQMKSHSSPRPELRLPARPALTYSEVVARGLNGESMQDDWSTWLVDLRDYVKRVRERANMVPKRAAITNGSWLVLFRDPADAFLEGGARSQDLISVYEDRAAMEARFPELYKHLEHAAVSGLSQAFRAAEIAFFIDPATVAKVMHGLRLSYDTTRGNVQGPTPVIKVVPWLFLGSRAGTWLSIQGEDDFELPTRRVDFAEHLQEVHSAAKVLLSDVNSRLGTDLQPTSIEDHYAAALHELSSVYDIGGDLYLVITGQHTHYFRGAPTVTGCPWHNWGAASESHCEVEGGPYLRGRITPRSFFHQPEPQFCAHRVVQTIKQTRLSAGNRVSCGTRSGREGDPFCEIWSFETQLCCRTCVFETVCSRSRVFRLPCSTPLPHSAVAGSRTGSAENSVPTQEIAVISTSAESSRRSLPVTNPVMREGTEFPATVVFVLADGLKDCTDGPMIPNALGALNEVLRDTDARAYVLSTIAGAIVIAPDVSTWRLEDTLSALSMAKVGFRLKIGITHGNVEVVTDIDGERNLIGLPINIAARLATSRDNTGLLIHESYATYAEATLSSAHWLHRSQRKSIAIEGKPQDPLFSCFVGPHNFDAKQVERNVTHPFRNAVLVAYDLPMFSAGDRAQLRKRFTRLVSVFNKLRQSSPMPTATFLLSPGGDGGVLVLPEMTLIDAVSIASRLRELAKVESLDHAPEIAVEVRIGVHYGQINEYENARGLQRPTGIHVFIADEIAGDDHARRKDGIVLTRLIADSAAAGSESQLTAQFEELPRIAKGPAMDIQRYVQRTPLIEAPAQSNTLPFATVELQMLSAQNPEHVSRPFEVNSASLISKTRKHTEDNVVVPTLWKVAALPVENRKRATKSELHEMLVKALITSDGGTGRTTRWPALLRPQYARKEARVDGTQIWRHISETDVGNFIEEEQLGLQQDGAIWFQRASFWDADEVQVDFGQCSFDTIVFLKMIVKIGNTLDIGLYNIKLTLQVPQSNTIITIQTRELRARQPMRLARVSTTFHEASVVLGPKTSLPNDVVAGLAKRLLDGIANECSLENEGSLGGDGPSFLELDEMSVLDVTEKLR